MADLARVAARGAGITVGAQLARFVIQMGSIAVMSRFLTPSQVGLVAMATAVLNLAEIVRDFGLSSAAIQAETLSKAERSNLFWINLAIGTTCAVLAAGSAPLIAHFYHDPAVMPIIWTLSWLFIVSGVNTQFRADLARSLRFKSLAFTEVTAQAAAMVVGISLAVAGAGQWAIVGQQITLSLVTCIMNVVQCRWLPGLPDRSVPMGRFLTFGSHLLATNVMGFAINNVDNIAVGAVWGPAKLGLYTRAYQLVQVPLQQVNAPLTRVVLPILAQVQNEARAFQRYFQQFQLVMCYIMGLGFGLMAGVSKPLVRVLFGPDWSGVTPILAVLAIAGIFKGIDSANYSVWVAKGRTKLLLKVYLISRPIMLAVILCGLPWGPVGVATGHLVSAVGFWAFSLPFMCRRLDLQWRPLITQTLRILGIVVAPAGLLAFLGTQLPTGPVAQLLVGALFATFWAGAAVMCVGPLRRELAPVVGLIMRRQAGEPSV